MNEFERYRDLAERALGRSATGTEVSLTLAGLPPEAGDRIRLPEGTHVVGGIVRRPTGDVASVGAFVESSLAPKAFDALVRGLYEADGYRAAPQPSGPMGGFVRSSGMRSITGAVLCRGEDGPWIHTSSRAAREGSEGIVVWNAPAPGGGPCAPHHYAPAPLAGVLAPLEAPDGVELMPGGGYGGGGGSWTMGGTAFTKLSARELIEAFGAQLEGAGASSLGSGGDEVVAWSQWKLAKDPWEALLLAFGRGERKELQLRVEREDYRKRDDGLRVQAAGFRSFGF
jgi:hypothetical protein